MVELPGIDQLVRKLIPPAGGRKFAVLMGAGGSAPLPTANDIKRALLLGVLRAVNPNNAPADLDDDLKTKLAEPYMTLELTFSMFEYFLNDRKDAVRFFEPERTIRIALNEADESDRILTTPGNLAIALLRKVGLVGVIATPNFDSLLIRTMDSLDLQYRILTAEQFSGSDVRNKTVPSKCDVFMYHGTLVDCRSAKNHFDPRPAILTTPSTLLVRGLMRPYDPDRARYVQKMLNRGKKRKVLVFGYSGNDHFDMNVVISEMKSRGSIVDRDDLLWTIFGDNATDVSDFMVNEVRPAFYRGDFASAALDRLLGYDPELPGGRRDLHVDAPKMLQKFGLERVKTYRSDNTARYEYKVRKARPFSAIDCGDQIFPATVAGSPLFVAKARALIQAFRQNVPGAWVATEHYSLESYGFSQEQIRHLSGSSIGSEDAPILFAGIDARLFLRAQETYWSDVELSSPLIEKLQGAALASPEHTLSHLFGRSFSMFKAAGEEVDVALDAQNLPDVVRALLLIFKAMAVDYQGLIWNRVSRVVSFGQRDAAKRAIELFKDTMALAQKAAETVGRPEDSADLAIRDIVGYWIWHQIGEDNAARPMLMAGYDLASVMSAYGRLIEARSQAIEALEWQGEALFLIPQTALRAAEAYRSVYSCEGNSSLPRPPDVPQSSLLHLAEGFLTLARTMRAHYEAKVTVRNHLFIAVYDCDVVDAVNRRSSVCMLTQVRRCVRIYGARSKEDARTRGFMRNLARRLASVTVPDVSSSLAMAAQKAINMIDAVL